MARRLAKWWPGVTLTFDVNQQAATVARVHIAWWSMPILLAKALIVNQIHPLLWLWFYWSYYTRKRTKQGKEEKA